MGTRPTLCPRAATERRPRVSPGVVVQFSTNNGVKWQFLRELDFGSFLEPQVVTIELPPAAKTPYTVFRWWQPQQGGWSGGETHTFTPFSRLAEAFYLRWTDKRGEERSRRVIQIGVNGKHFKVLQAASFIIKVL